MIAADTSSFVAHFDGRSGPDVEALEQALARKIVVLPPAVLSELLSNPDLPNDVNILLRTLPFLTVTDGYWERVGALRAQVIARGRKARLADALIAQSCLDHNIPLITRDTDFRHFACETKLEIIPSGT